MQTKPPSPRAIPQARRHGRRRAAAGLDRPCFRAVAVALALLAGPCLAQNLADGMNYQGYAKLDNVEVTGSKPVAFWVYAVQTGEGDPLWGPQTAQLEFVGGRFNVTLSQDESGRLIGDVLAATSFPDGCWLEISIDGSILQPRQRLLCAPFAFTARLGVVPIGSVIAWCPHLAGTPSLDDVIAAGFALCNGTTAGSQGVVNPVIIGALPNLNGEGRFLRGGNTSGNQQSDAMQGHSHAPGTLNITNSGSHAHNMASWRFRNGSGSAAKVVLGQINDPWSSEGWLSTESSSHTHGAASFAGATGSPTPDEAFGEPRTAAETRPVNMSVVWIMRVK